MAGFSITLFRLDDELERYLKQPASNESFLKA
jgi:dihydroxyacetone kinase